MDRNAVQRSSLLSMHDEGWRNFFKLTNEDWARGIVMVGLCVALHNEKGSKTRFKAGATKVVEKVW